MPTADKVIIELEARVSKAEADIRRYKSTTESSLKAVEQASARAAKKQEAEFKRAARAIKAEQSQIGASMKALALPSARILARLNWCSLRTDLRAFKML